MLQFLLRCWALAFRKQSQDRLPLNPSQKYPFDYLAITDTMLARRRGNYMYRLPNDKEGLMAPTSGGFQSCVLADRLTYRSGKSEKVFHDKRLETPVKIPVKTAKKEKYTPHSARHLAGLE